jgi:hypothetical protein
MASSVQQLSLQPVQEALTGWAAGLLGGPSRSWGAVVFACPLRQGTVAALQQPSVASFARAAQAAGVPLVPVLLCGGDAGASVPAAFEAVQVLAEALGVPAASVCQLDVGDLPGACADPQAVSLLPPATQRQLASSVQAVQWAVLAALLDKGSGVTEEGRRPRPRL